VRTAAGGHVTPEEISPDRWRAWTGVPMLSIPAKENSPNESVMEQLPCKHGGNSPTSCLIVVPNEASSSVSKDDPAARVSLQKPPNRPDHSSSSPDRTRVLDDSQVIAAKFLRSAKDSIDSADIRNTWSATRSGKLIARLRVMSASTKWPAHETSAVAPTPFVLFDENRESPPRWSLNLLLQLLEDVV